jgi:uncharacterized protein (UPF0333 family)
MDLIKKRFNYLFKNNFYLNLLLIYLFFFFFFEFLSYISPVRVDVDEKVYFLFYCNILFIIPFFFLKFFKLSLPFTRIDNLIKIITSNGLKYIIILVLLGILFTIISKYFLYKDYIDNYGPISNCFIPEIRFIWSTQNFTNSNFFLIYSILSPIGVLLINFNILLLIYIYANINVVKKLNFFFILILIILSLVIYFLSNFKSNVIISFIIFTLSLFLINFLFFKKKKIFKFTFFLIFFLLLLVLTSFYFQNSCYENKLSFAKEIETRKIILIKKKDNEELKYNLFVWTPFLIKNNNSNDNNIIYKIRDELSKDNITSFVTNKIILYALASKNNGHFLIQKSLIVNSQKELPKYIFLKKFYNSFISDFKFLIFNDAAKFPLQIYDKPLGSYSISSLLIYDFKYFGLLIYFFIIYLLFIFINILYLYFDKNLIDIFLFVYTLFVITSFVGGELFFIFETLNFRFIFFIIFSFFLLSFIRNKKVVK